MKFKMLVAAAAIAASANATAAFSPGTMVLTLLAKDATQNTNVSLSVDLGIQALGFEQGILPSGDLLADGSAEEMAVTNFLSTYSGASITYDLAGTWVAANETVGSQERTGRVGLVMSANSLVQADETQINPATISGSGVGNTNVWVDQVGQVAGTDISAIFDPADSTPGGAERPEHNLSNLAVQRTALGLGMDLYSFESYVVSELVEVAPGVFLPGEETFADLDLAGTISLSADGTTLAYSAIPLPAAAWLFGTAILGLAGVARRRAA